MKTDVNQEMIQQYQKDGFLVVRNFLSDSEKQEMIQAIQQCIIDFADTRIIGDEGIAGAKYGEKSDYYTNVFLQKVNLWKVNQTIKKYMLNPQLGKMLCKLSGAEGMRVWHDQTLQKKPWGNPTSFHLDTPYWSFSNRKAISIWIALDDATLQNGCLAFIPGSHHLTTQDNLGIGPNFGDLLEVYPQCKNMTPVYAEMKAGDCSFHNGYAIHGAGANMTPNWRRAMTCAYMPEGSTFNGTRNILPKDYFESLKIGDELNSDEMNPLVYSFKNKKGSEYTELCTAY